MTQANLQGRLCRGRARTAIREINFVGVGAGHKILSSFGVTRQWWMRREERKDEITLKKKLQNYFKEPKYHGASLPSPKSHRRTTFAGWLA